VLDKLERSELVLIAAVSFFSITGLAGLAFNDPPQAAVGVEPVVSPRPGTPRFEASDGAAWLAMVRSHCNAVEVDTYMGWRPAPPSPDGDMHKAACYALAGRIDQAREVIEDLPPERRYQAAGVVFQVGHPAADAGDDIAAGPLMELVVEFWPNHYMALYHAGAARFERGDFEVARDYLTRFLAEYDTDDGWTGSARSMLEKIG
jgi:hypothetical protein